MKKTWVTFTAFVWFGLAAGHAGAASGPALIPIDISAYATNSWSIFDGGETIPKGNQSYHGIPYNIPSGENNAWIAFHNSGTRSVTIPINVGGVDKVHALMDTVWGQRGPSSYVSVTFTGSAGATKTYQLIGNVDFRDFNQPSNYSSQINNTTTVNAWTGPVYGSSGCVGSACYHILDQVTFTLPPEFANQNLLSMTIHDTGQENFQVVILAALTVNGVALPPGPTVSSVGSSDLGITKFTPGMPIYITGSGFGSSATDAATVMIGTEQAPVLQFIDSSHLIAQVPVDAPVGSANLTVIYQGETSGIFSIQLLTLAPAITPDLNGNGAFFYDSSGNPISDAHPAIPNAEIYLLAIGLGTTSPAQVTNTPASEPSPTTQAVQVNLGSKTIQPDYAGLFVGGLPGLYQVSFKVPGDTAMGSQAVTISIGGLTSNSVNVTVALPLPVVNAVVNGATFAAGPAAANSFVSLFGINFGSNNTTDNIFPAMSFHDVSVLVNGAPVPLYFVVGTGGQINIVLPSELGASGTADVQVQTSEGMSATFTLQLTADSVGLFRIADPSKPSRQNGAVLFTNTAWKVMPLSMAAALKFPDCSTVTTASICGKPAKAGDQIEIYVTGLGKATPNGDPNGKVLPTGSLAPTDGSVLYETVEPPTVKIGGVKAEVSFSGIAPGNAGQYQINVKVPDGVQPSDDVTLEVTMPDGSTDTVTIAITS